MPTLWNRIRTDRLNARQLFGTSAIVAAGAFVCASALQAQAPADEAAMHYHVMKARDAAGAELALDYYHRCFVDPVYGDTIAQQRKQMAAMEPVKVFDNIYFLGHNHVSAWAVDTNEGFVIFDTLNNPEEAEEYIVGGLTKLGLDPTRIKYIVINHEHADHYGGAQYLKDKFGAHILASAPAWEGIESPETRRPDLAPKRDTVVTDGETLTIGGVPFTFYVTPGHSLGTISTIFPTTDNGKPHMVGFFGGMGSPHTNVARQTIMASMKRWQGITEAAGVDTLIANHQVQDRAVEKLEFIKVRHPDDPNPFVLGWDVYQRYFDVQSECAAVAIARGVED